MNRTNGYDKLLHSLMDEFVNYSSAPDLGSATLQTVGLDGLEGEFNKLGPTKESQLRVISGIASLINRAGANKLLQNYSLSRTSREIVVRSSSQFFSISAGHAVPLARVVCELCKIKPDLGDLIKSYFYKYSVLTIPYFGLEASSTNDLCQLLGFESIIEQDGRRNWEPYEKWLGRQMKIIVTFFTVMIQPEAFPFGLNDAYIWLVNVINMISKGTTSAPTFVAPLLDNVLRTIGAQMFESYGDRLISLLRIISDEIMHRLDVKSPKAKIELKRLEQFLKAATAANGRKFLTL